MKVPAVAIAAAFACGIALGLSPAIAREATSHTFLIGGFVVAAVFIAGAATLFVDARLAAATVLATVSWIALGVVAAWISEQPRSLKHIMSLVEAKRLDLHNPLKWHGRLRDEPQKLPWGYGLEVELSGVEYQSELLPALGGLRLSFSPRPNDPPLPELHAGDQVVATTQARQPQIFRDEGAFDRRAYLATQNIDLIGTLRAPELIERTGSGPHDFNATMARVRHKLRDVLDGLFVTKPQVAAVLRAMLLGDRSFVDRDEAASFQKTGVFHILVVAGLHVGALAAFLFWAGRRFRLGPGWIIVFTLTVLSAYVAVVEQRPPVLRAALMAGVVVLAGLFYRRLDLLNSAGVAALVLMIARPVVLKDSSFQLSFVAIGCIGGLALPWLENTVQPYLRALRGWRDVTRDAAHAPVIAQFRLDLRSAARTISGFMPSWASGAAENAVIGGIRGSLRIWELLVLTIVLQIGMLPMMARDFHRVTLAAPLVNLVAVPLTGIVVPLGFLTLGTALLFAAAGKILAVPLAWVTVLLLQVVEWFARFPRWSYRIPGPYAWLTITFFALIVLLAIVLRVSHRWRRQTALCLCAGVAACTLLIAIFPFAPKWLAGKLEVTVLDVGQGDSLFVVSPHGRTMLIDGGGAFGGFSGQDAGTGIDPGEEAVSPYLWSRGFQKIDIVALTHAHQDHIGGLFAILENFRVSELWISRELSLPALKRLEQLARSRNVVVKDPVYGQSFLWDGVEELILWPDTAGSQIASIAKNDDSFVMHLQYGDRSVLLPGDAEKDAERGMLAENEKGTLRADVLKVGHHGSKNSTMPDFLGAVNPRVAIISAGEDNPYGHPSPELLERLENDHIRILRTDRDGAVHVVTDGKQVEVSCFVPCSDKTHRGLLEQANAPNREQNEHQ